MESEDLCAQLVTAQAKVTHFAEETLDVVFHIFIIFTALCGLLEFVIGPTYSRVMQDLLRTTIGQIEVPPLSPTQEVALIQAQPALKVLQRMCQKPDRQVQTNNHWLFVYAHTISVMLLLIFLLIMWLLRKMIGVKAATPTTNVLKNNLLLIFPAILVAEFAFFQMIAINFVPLSPSDFVQLFRGILYERVREQRPAAAER